MNKRTILKYPRFFKFIIKIRNSLMFSNKLKAKGVRVNYGLTVLNGVKIYNFGNNNEINFSDFSRVSASTITIYGNNNKISIGKDSSIRQAEFYIEDDNNEITIGDNTSLCGKIHLAAIEGTKIIIGDNCLFSSNIHFQTGDSHSILDMNGKRTNPSKDIIISNHVWIGTKVTCLKGTFVSSDSIVAATSTLCKSYDIPNSIIAGVPGKIIKSNINWDSKRIPFND